jgi:hypothetical protein
VPEQCASARIEAGKATFKVTSKKNRPTKTDQNQKNFSLNLGHGRKITQQPLSSKFRQKCLTEEALIEAVIARFGGAN